MIKNWICTIMGMVAMVWFQAYGQIAVVVAPDGYANLRQAPSLMADVVGSLKQNTVVLIDGTYLDREPVSNWRLVYFAADEYCYGCSPDLSDTYLSGYVHISQLKNVEELQVVPSTLFNMRYTIGKFNSSAKEVEYGEDSTIMSINGYAYFGSDCGIPSTEITKVEATLGSRVFSLPLDLIWSIVHAQNNFRYFRNGSSYFALQRIGDGACSTEAIWVFDDRGLKQRLLGWSY